MKEFYFVCEFIWVAAKVWMTFELLSSLTERRRGYRTDRIARGCSVLAVAGFDIFNRLTTTTLFSNLLLVLFCVVLGLVGSFLYRMGFLRSFTISYLFWILIAYIDFFIQSLFYIVLVEAMNQRDAFLQVSVTRGIYLLVYTLVVIGIGKWLCKRLPVIYDTVKHKVLIGICSTVGTFWLMIYLQRVYLLEVSVEYMGVWELIILVSVFSVAALAAYFIRQRYEQEKELLQVKTDALWDSYQQFVDLYQEKSVLLHDEKNHILAIRCLVERGESQRALEYMDDLSARLQRSVIRSVTGHGFLDMIFDLKKQQAEQEGIAMELSFEWMPDIQLSDFDICALFANLLDNAIEANCALPAGRERWIRLTGKRHGHLLNMILENPAADAAQQKAGKNLQTEKDRRYHGFGLQSIRKVAESHDGYMEYLVHDGIFTQRILLNCLENIKQENQEEEKWKRAN